MRWIFAGLLILHGLIHLMGFAKAFDHAGLPHLTQPISRGVGLVWLTAALLMLLTAAMLLARSPDWWIAGAAALVCSQVVIVSSWADAWAGTAVNALLLAGVSYGFMTDGPLGFRAQFHRDMAASLGRAAVASQVTEAELRRLPEPVRRYLQSVGVVGQPRVQNYRLRFRGRIRSEPNAAWMPFEADQHSVVDDRSRLFLMHARTRGMPVQAFHRLIDGHATMQVRLAGLFRIADARGDVMDRSETVTLFNDMCLLAPATLLDPRIVWEPIDATTVRARFTNGAQTISATLAVWRRRVAGELSF